MPAAFRPSDISGRCLSRPIRFPVWKVPSSRIREMEKKARKEKETMNANVSQGNVQAAGGKRKPKVKITKGKLLAKKKKTDDDDEEAARLAAMKKSDIQITGASTLSSDEVDRMVNEAEKFADADKEKREAVDVRNVEFTCCRLGHPHGDPCDREA